jgi:hypothetical protein
VTLAELKAILAGDIFAAFQEESGATDEVLQGYLDNGIPLDWARGFASRFRSMPVSRWPKVLHPPKLRLPRMQQERSMLSSKMELQNAGAKSKRVKIAASMTEQDTPAKKALFAANLTPQEVATALGVGRSTVNAWCNGTRSIPRRYRELLASKHRIPAKVWKNRAE